MATRTDILPKRYRDVEHLARGGMGDVYRATDTVLGRTVAVKVLAERYSDDEGIRQRFTNEALAAARLSGTPNTVTIFDVGEFEERPFIVMEFLEGGSLEQRLKTGPQDTADVLRWLEQTAAAVDAAHAAGIVHRDVKPGNLLLDGRGAVHVADFGVASAAGLDSLTMTGMVLGTAGYLAPEQARGERASPASDRYALAVVAFELLTGSRPFEAESTTAEAAAHVNAPVPSISAQSDLPRELDRVFERGMAKDPRARYRSAAEFAADLRAGLAGATAETRPIAAVVEQEYVPPRPGRSRGLLIAAALLGTALLLGGGLAIASVLGGSDEPETRTVVSKETVTVEGRTVTRNETRTVPAEPTTPTTTATTATTAPTAAASGDGVALTDQATALLEQGRWAEAEAVARQAVAALQGSGERYEAYAEYDLGRALAEQDKCEEALLHLNRSEQLQGRRSEITDAKSKCQD